MDQTVTPDFLPVLLGSDMNVYGMARSFHEAYGIKSVAVGKGRLNATSHSRIVSVEEVEPNLEDDKVGLPQQIIRGIGMVFVLPLLFPF